MLKRILTVQILVLSLAACGGASQHQQAMAPVIDGWRLGPTHSNLYTVQPGDTLYSIAWAFNEDYRTLAEANHLRAPYHIKSGERLQMPTEATRKAVAARTAKPVKKPKVVAKHQPKHTKTQHTSTPAKKAPTHYVSAPVKHWQWPVKGRVIETFSSKRVGNHGLNIAGRFGGPVRSAANGVVVYSGSGIRGYGNLVIIKHNSTYLSAYADNQKILVHTGEVVKAGQRIADVGRSSSGRVMLHFEIRKNGKPVNPLKYLKA